MDEKEQKRLEKLASSIDIPEDDWQKLQIELEIDHGSSEGVSEDTIQELANAQRQQQDEELAQLLESIKDKPEEVRKRILDELNIEKNTAIQSPFKQERDISAEEETIEEETEKSPPPEPEEKRDTKATLQVSDDKMHAFLTLIPPSGGGRKPTIKAIEAYLKKKGIISGINKDNIKKVVTEVCENGNRVTDYEVASGREPEEGVDGKIEVAFEEAEESDFLGEIDTTDVQAFGAVQKDQTLLSIKPAQPGRSGLTVYGEEIPIREVAHVQIDARRNTRRATDSIISTSPGIAYFYGDAIIVKKYEDCRIDVSLPEDKMSATVSLYPPVGEGQKLSKKLVMKSLRDRKITHGINEQTIEDAIEKASTEVIPLNNLPAARGEEPINGTDGRIVFKIRTEASHKLRKGQGEKIDFREKDSIINTAKGTLIAVHFPPQPKQKDGIDVCGNPIPATDGEEVEIALGKNIDVSEKTEQETGLSVKEYYAKIDGQVIFKNDKLDVEPLFSIDRDLDMEIGNIDFLGNVLIKGQVEDDYVVKAEGDIEIQGNVGASRIIAGRDIYIKGGVIGRATGEVRAGGNIFIRFAESANIIAHENINIDRAILNSEMAAGNSIICTREKGQIIGGHCIAKNLIDVNELGTPAGTKTDVTVGMDFFEIEQINTVNQNIKKFLGAQEKVETALEKINRYKNSLEGPMPEKIQKQYNEILQKKVLIEKKIHELKVRKFKIAVENESTACGEIVVRKNLETDVTLAIRNQGEETRQTRSNQHIHPHPESGKVVIEPFSGEAYCPQNQEMLNKGKQKKPGAKNPKNGKAGK